MNQIVYNRLTLRCNSNRDNLQASIDSMLESVGIAQASQRMVAMHEQAELKKHVNRNSKREIETQHILLVHHTYNVVFICAHTLSDATFSARMNVFGFFATNVPSGNTVCCSRSKESSVKLDELKCRWQRLVQT